MSQEINQPSLTPMLPKPGGLEMFKKIVCGSVLLGSVATTGLALEGYTPHPAISSTGSEVLISANNALRTYGEPTAIAATAFFLGGAVLRRRNKRLDAAMTITNRYPTARRVGIGLSVVLMSTTAASSTLGDSVAKGANVPVETLKSALPGHSQDVSVLLSTKYALPFDYTELDPNTPEIKAFEQQVVDKGGTVMPYSFLLGDVRRKKAKLNPSSSPIVLLPAQNINGISSKNFKTMVKNPDCQPIEVITNKQLGAHGPTGNRQGETILVQGKDAVVKDTISVYPGLDRSIAIAPLEQANGCITSELVSGIAIRGLKSNDLINLAKANSVKGDIDTMSDYEERYSMFWTRSVKPPDMQFIFNLFLTSLAGVAIVKTLDALMRRQQIAALSADGTKDSTFVKAEFLRVGADSVKALVLSSIPSAVLIGVNNSSQYGLAEQFDGQALGAGFTVGVLANVVGATASSLYITRTPKSAAVRE